MAEVIAGLTNPTADDLRRLVERLDREHAGEVMPEDAREVWNEANAALDEFAVRDERILELYNGGAVESSTDPYKPSRATRRDDPEKPRHLAEAQQAGLRAINLHAPKLSSGAGDRLEAIVRNVDDADPQGEGGRYLAAVGSPDYYSAFGKLLMDPAHGHLRFNAAETDAVRKVSIVQRERAMNVGTGSAGGFAVPFQLDPSIIMTGSGALNPIRQIARNEVTVSGTWKGVASDGVVASYGAEASAVTDASPTLVQPQVVAQRGTCFVPFSVELQQDYDGLLQELSRLMRDAIDVTDATKFLTGTGTNEPGGVLNIGGTGGLTTTQRVQTAVSATYAVGDPWLFRAAIPPRFLGNTTFVAAPGIWDKTYRFVGGNSTEPLQMPSREGSFLGRPKVEQSTMVTTTTTGSKIMIGGDWKTGFLVCERLGMQLELIPHIFGPAQGSLPTVQRGAICFYRTGSGVIGPNALRYLEVL